MKSSLKWCLGFLLTFLVLFPAGAQQLTDGELPGLKITKTTHYDGTSLYGYINGGSSLYFEYGFDRLTVQEIDLQGEKLTVEYYRMKSSPAAFGIWSINTFQCESADPKGMTDCQNPYQLQLNHGHYYISVVNQSGNTRAQQLSRDLAAQLRLTLPADEAIVPPAALAPGTEQLTGKTKLIFGELGLQNGLPDWSLCFEGIAAFQLWITQREVEGKELRRAVIAFNHPSDLQRFIQNTTLVPDGEGWKSAPQQTERWSVKKIGETEIMAEVQ